MRTGSLSAATTRRADGSVRVRTDPGIFVDIYSDAFKAAGKYVIPGPAVMAASTSGSSPPSGNGSSSPPADSGVTTSQTSTSIVHVTSTLGAGGSKSTGRCTPIKGNNAVKTRIHKVKTTKTKTKTKAKHHKVTAKAKPKSAVKVSKAKGKKEKKGRKHHDNRHHRHHGKAHN